jgi:DNA polymerase III alpha subunit (gram-positive type)
MERLQTLPSANGEIYISTDVETDGPIPGPRPEAAMRRYMSWIATLAGKPVFVAYPAGFDFLFVYWYLIRFVGESPFSHSALDIKSFAMAMLKLDYRESGKRSMPKRWFDDLPHSHVALDDAIEQGALFCNMLAESRRR